LAKQPKYRPVLTPTQITHIINLCKLESPLSNESISVLNSLVTIKAKIDNSLLIPAYSLDTPQSQLEDLGDTATLATITSTKEEAWEIAYEKYSLDPISCNLIEIQGAHEWMYLNDLMSAVEVEAFEKVMLADMDTLTKES